MTFKRGRLIAVGGADGVAGLGGDWKAGRPPTGVDSGGHGGVGSVANQSARHLGAIVFTTVGQRSVELLDDLRVPPGNRLEALKGDQKGRHSIRVNERVRVTFRIDHGNAHGSAARTTTEEHTMIPTHRTPTHPGEMLLEEFLRPLGLTHVEVADRMGISLNRLNELIRAKRGVTADTALRLARVFKTSPEFWMNLQATWDLYHAKRAAAG